jgi:anion-transporting  ArsA/GET3 family ATPase
MRTIAVIARKGGSGKSTVAVHLALAAHLRGMSVMLADTDAQRSASQILRNRSQSSPRVVGTSGAKLFPLQLQAQREGVDVLVIDTPAVLEKTSATRSSRRISASLSYAPPTWISPRRRKRATSSGACGSH